LRSNIKSRHNYEGKVNIDTDENPKAHQAFSRSPKYRSREISASLRITDSRPMPTFFVLAGTIVTFFSQRVLKDYVRAFLADWKIACK